MAGLDYKSAPKAADVFIFNDDANFIEQGWINRNTVLMSGTPLLFSLSIFKISSYSQIRVVGNDKDRPQHWQALSITLGPDLCAATVPETGARAWRPYT